MEELSKTSGSYRASVVPERFLFPGFLFANLFFILGVVSLGAFSINVTCIII